MLRPITSAYKGNNPLTVNSQDSIRVQMQYPQTSREERGVFSGPDASFQIVIPAQAGIQAGHLAQSLDARLRGHDNAERDRPQRALRSIHFTSGVKVRPWIMMEKATTA